jgi:hypothetical protein
MDFDRPFDSSVPSPAENKHIGKAGTSRTGSAALTSPFFTPGDAFLATFDGTSTDDEQDGEFIEASCFTAGDKVAVQAWFGSYAFTDKSGKAASGPTFRLVKLWRLQASISALSSVDNSPVTKRRRIF